MVTFLLLSYAYLLVFHGSRNHLTQAAASRLKQLLSAKCQSINILTQQNYLGLNFSNSKSKASDFVPAPLIELAALELTPISLSQSLINFAHKASQKGFSKIKIIPLFLSPGVHVQQDIPAEIASAEKQIDYRLTIELSPYLGEYSGMMPLLLNKFAQLPARTRILIAHGSRLSTGAMYYHDLAIQLNANLAFWSIEPKLSDQIKAQIALGIDRIALLPYFLFPGKITEAIASEISSLQQEYPHVKLLVGSPLGETEALVELIAREA